MMTVPETRPSLLLRLRDARDQQAWSEFWEIYQPLILRLARQKGLQDADAREVTQEVLLAVSKAVGGWETNLARGSFRGWLATIARNLVVNFLIRQSRHPRGTGNSDFARWLDEVPAADCGESQLFDLERRRQVFLWATEEIEHEFRSDTWQAFWETSVRQRSVAEVAHDLKMSNGAVYVARSRVMKRLREKVSAMESPSNESVR